MRALRERTHQKGGKPRRWDITERVYNLLESGPKTLSMLYRLLNPGVPNTILRRAGSRGMRTGKPMVDKRIVKAQIEFLMREGLVHAETKTRLIQSGRRRYRFPVTHYYRTDVPRNLHAKTEPKDKDGRASQEPYHDESERRMLHFLREMRDA